MLVLKIASGKRVTIFDRTDGACPPITIMAKAQGNQTRIYIDADPRYGVVREDAKLKTPPVKPQSITGGKDAQPISA